MSNKPLVSVLMTAYNREKYIAEAIESVLASTYTNFELIVVDDCSTDKTVEIAKNYEAKDERVKVYINEKNLGDYPNRNKAASLAKGVYLKYLDSDDLIYPNGLEVLVNMMEQFPDAGYGLCSLDQDKKKIFPFMISSEEAFRRHFVEKISLFHKAPLSSIIRSHAFHSVNGFANLGGEGDYEMWLKLSLQYPVVLMPHGIVWYREHEEQIDFNRRNDSLVRFKYFLVTRGILDRMPLTKEEKELVYFNLKRRVNKYILSALRKFSFRESYRMFKLFYKSEK